MTQNQINNLFQEYDIELIEKFEIIFDRAQDEKTAKSNALDYYLCLVEDGKHIDIDIDQIVESAESYGYDFDNFRKLVEENI